MEYTKFEKARIIGSRALQIAMGAPILAKLSDKKIEEMGFNPIKIAMFEFEEDMIPITVKRPHPSGKIELKKAK